MRKLEEREKAALEGDRSKRKFNSVEGGEHVTPEVRGAARLQLLM